MTTLGNLGSANSIATTDYMAVEQGGVLKKATPTLLPFVQAGNGQPTTVTAILGRLSRKALGIVIDGGGSAITTGVKGDLVIPWTGTIKQWTVLADQSGSIAIDVWKTAYASAPPTVANTIAGSQKPTLTTATKNQNTNPNTWTTAVTAGDVLRFNVDSVSTVTRVTCVIEMDL